MSRLKRELMEKVVEVESPAMYKGHKGWLSRTSGVKAGS
jgi:hypothetical protein